jgi:hypothetical protein
MLNFTMAGSSGKGVSKKAGGSSGRAGLLRAEQVFWFLAVWCG